MLTLMTKEVRQAWRSFRLPGLYLVLIFLAILDPLSTRYMGEIIQKFGQGLVVIVPPPSPEMALSSFIGDIAQMGVLIIIGITMGSVAGERASGVTTFIVTKPVPRRTYVLAKYVVLFLGSAVGIAASVLLAYLYTFTLIGALPVSRVALAAVAVAIYAELIMTATFSASMVTSGALAAGGAGVAFMALLGVIGSFLGRSAIGPWLPSALVGNANRLLTGASSEAGNPLAASLVLKPGATAAVLSAVLFWAGFTKFKRQDLQ